jgi:hypothetical protein
MPCTMKALHTDCPHAVTMMWTGKQDTQTAKTMLPAETLRKQHSFQWLQL